MSNLSLPLWARKSSFPAKKVLTTGKLHRSQVQHRIPAKALQVFCVAAICGFALAALLCREPHKDAASLAPAAPGGNVPSAHALALQKVCPTGSLKTNTPDQPLWKLRGSFLPAADFAGLRRELLETRPLLQPQQFAEGFNAVNVDFNRAGWAQLEGLGHSKGEHSSLAPLLIFAKPLRLLTANAWSLNAVYSQPRSVKRSGSSGPQDPHIDNLGLKGEHGLSCTLASHQTSVLYLSVPQDMAGGNLTVWGQQGKDGMLLGTPEGSVRPEENLMVSFRGNAPHRVEEFDSQSMRVSLTLEQYLVPEQLYWAVQEFEVNRLRY